MDHEDSTTGISGTALGADYTDEEVEFLKAMERYRREKRIRFPSVVDHLRVLKALGYRKVVDGETAS